jgi:signal transduction histidine kinase
LEKEKEEDEPKKNNFLFKGFLALYKGNQEEKDDEEEEDQQLYEEEKKEEECIYSLNDVMSLENDKLDKMIFKVSVAGQEQHARYVQIKITNIKHGNAIRQILQIINMSANVECNRTLAQNAFLSLINACVSHELRNPLNSIMA